MAYAGIDREWLMARLKVSRVAIDKLLDGRSKSMTAERCAVTARLLKVDYFWFATGQGEMLGKTEPLRAEGAQWFAAEPIPSYNWPMSTVTTQEYRTLTERQQGYIEGQIRAMLDGCHNKSGESQAAA